MKKYSFVILLCCLWFFKLTAQSDTVNVPIVRYDFKTSTFDQPFPFDQSFLIRLANVPENYQTLEVEIREIRKLRKIIKALSSTSRGTLITNEQIFEELQTGYKHNLTMEQFHGDTVFLQLAPLHPNTDYIFEITPPGGRMLTELEKDNLIYYLYHLPITDKIINTLIYEVCMDNKGLQSLNFLNTILNQINSEFETALKDFNSLYIFKEINSNNLAVRLDEEVLDIMGGFTTQFDNFKNAVNAFYSQVKDSIPAMKDLDFCKDVQAINWMKIDAGLSFPDYNNFVKRLQNLESDSKLSNDDYLDDERIIGRLDSLIKKHLIPMRNITRNYVANIVAKHTSVGIGIGATYYRGSTANARSYLSLDAGIGINPKRSNSSTYAGINIYFTPINTAIPLRKYGFWNGLCKRLSLLAGVTLDSVEEENTIKGFWGNKAVLAGAGCRILPWLKVSYSRLIYYELSPNPLVSKQFLASDGFFSVSVDANLSSLFKNIIN